MFEKYKQIKEKYPDSVIIIRSGNFYEVLGEEAYLMNNIFGYKVREFSKTIRSGFPLIGKNKVIEKFNQLQVNYVLSDEENILKSFNDNNYSRYLEKNTNVIEKCTNTKNKQKNALNSSKIYDKFKIAKDIKKTIIYLDKVISNFPKSEKILRDRITNDLYSMLEITYVANSIEERVSYQKQLLSKLKMIDFYILLAHTKHYISDKQYNQIGNFLINIIKEINAWIKNEEIQ